MKCNMKIGKWKFEKWNWKMKIGKWKLENENLKNEVEKWKLENEKWWWMVMSIIFEKYWMMNEKYRELFAF